MKISTMFGDVSGSLFRSPVTEKYPFERRDTPERLRGLLQWNPEQCTGCGLCAKDCPQECITGERKEAHVIDTAKCIKCGVCKDVCTFDAVRIS